MSGSPRRLIESKEQSYIIPLFQVGGSAFTNQPAGDGVELISNNAADTQLVTVWYTDQTTGALTSETITMNGATQVSLTSTNVGNVVGVYLGDVYGKNSVPATGTITVREASGNATITTIAATKRSIGTQIFVIRGLNTTIHNVSGNTWTNTKAFPTINNSFQLTAGMIKDEQVIETLYFLGDSTGSVAQIEVWED